MSRLLLAATLAILCNAAVKAQPLEGFKSPSGNIFCSYAGAGDGIPASLRCDIMKISNRPPPRPRDCELEYGQAFEITRRSRGTRLCYGDTIANDQYRVLPYGEVWRNDGFTCFSAESGITCRNDAGGGFELSRARQRVF